MQVGPAQGEAQPSGGSRSERRVPRPILRAHAAAHGAGRPPDGAQAEEEADGVTAARRWRDVCRVIIDNVANATDYFVRGGLPSDFRSEQTS